MYDVRSKATCYPFIPESLHTADARYNARLINDMCIYIDVSTIAQLLTVHNISAYITAILEDTITIAVQLGLATITCIAEKSAGLHRFMYSSDATFVTHILIYCSLLLLLKLDTQCQMLVACLCFRLYKRPAMLTIRSAAKPCILTKETSTLLNETSTLLSLLRFTATGHNIDIRVLDNELTIYCSPGLRPHEITDAIYHDATLGLLESRRKRGVITINGLSGDILILGQGQTYVRTDPGETLLHILLLNKRDQRETI